MTTRPNLRIVSDEPANKWPLADVALDHRYRAKRSAQSPVEHACAIEAYRRPISKKTKLGYLVAAALVAGAFWMWRS